LRFAGRAAIVTGAASGLGREVTLALTAEGGRVLLADVNVDGAEAVAAEARATGGTAEVCRCDVSREAEVAAAVADCVERFGRLDVMHSNAGTQVIALLEETTDEELERLLAVNVRGAIWSCKHAVAAMRRDGGGSIVITASISSLTGDPLLPAYTTTKTALLGLMRSVAVAYAADGIRCNAVCPGDMDTPMLQEYFDAAPDPALARRDVEEAYPGGRIAHPREVARAVLFLASDEASFVSGTYVVVDGGLTAKTY
jgi:NAD(P)-dependent dehydrogenase (short-subunit alcohol dehydrogenase family)